MEEIKRQNDQYKRDIHESNDKRRELQTKYEQTLKDHQNQLEKEYASR